MLMEMEESALIILLFFFIALNKFGVYWNRNKGLEYDFTDTNQYLWSNRKQKKGAPTHCPVILAQDLLGRQQKFARGRNLVWAKMDFFLCF